MSEVRSWLKRLASFKSAVMKGAGSDREMQRRPRTKGERESGGEGEGGGVAHRDCRGHELSVPPAR